MRSMRAGTVRGRFEGDLDPISGIDPLVVPRGADLMAQDSRQRHRRCGERKTYVRCDLPSRNRI